MTTPPAPHPVMDMAIPAEAAHYMSQGATEAEHSLLKGKLTAAEQASKQAAKTQEMLKEGPKKHNSKQHSVIKKLKEEVSTMRLVS